MPILDTELERDDARRYLDAVLGPRMRVPTRGLEARIAALAPAPAPLQELPREKAARAGITALDDHELVALLLRTGRPGEDVRALAAALLEEHDGLIGLSRRSPVELSRRPGLGAAKAAELAAAFELARRLARASLRQRPLANHAAAVAALLTPLLGCLDHEEMWCLPLDVQSRLIGEPQVVSRGEVDGTDACPRSFFRAALAAGATSCLAAHNHPSGDPTPSHADQLVTQRLVAAGRLIDLPLLDHIVLAAGGAFVSLRATSPGCFAR